MHGDPDWGHIARRAGAPKTQSVIVSECQTTSPWQRPSLIPAHPWIKRYKNHSLFDIFLLTLINCRRRMHVFVSIVDYPRHHFSFLQPFGKSYTTCIISYERKKNYLYFKNTILIFTSTVIEWIIHSSTSWPKNSNHW